LRALRVCEAYRANDKSPVMILQRGYSPSATLNFQFQLSVYVRGDSGSCVSRQFWIAWRMCCSVGQLDRAVFPSSPLLSGARARLYLAPGSRSGSVSCGLNINCSVRLVPVFQLMLLTVKRTVNRNKLSPQRVDNILWLLGAVPYVACSALQRTENVYYSMISPWNPWKSD
jgi:hypothetical protein